jgi:hypothetical protein
MRSFFTFFAMTCLLLVFSNTYAQSSFELTYGGTDKEYGYDLLQTTDGGYLLAGLSYGFGSGSSDFYLVRTDEAGAVTWTETYGGIGAEFPTRIKATSDGGFVLAGTTTSSGAGSNDGYVVKINEVGSAQWIKTYGGGSTEVIYDIEETSDQGFVMIAKTQSFGNFSGEVYLIKTNSVGDTTFTKRYGGSSLNWGLSVEQTSDNGYIISGKTQSFGAGLHDAYVIRTNAVGDTLWTKTFGGSAYDIGNEILVTNDGGFIMAGTYNAGDVDGLTGDIMLIKMSANGILEWQQTYGGSGGEFANKLILTSDGGYFIVGATTSYGAGSYDLYAIKTNSVGDTLWTSTYGGSGVEVGYSAVQTMDGGYAMVGRTNSMGNGQDDIYLIKTHANGTVGIAETANNQQKEALVYPNPVTDHAVISSFEGFENGESYLLSVFDVTGKKCKEMEDIRQRSIHLDRGGLSSGMYFFKVFDSSSQEVSNGRFLVN